MKVFAGVLLLSIGLAQGSGLPAVSERVWAKPDHFWWRRSVPGGNLWLTVDAKHPMVSGNVEKLIGARTLTIQVDGVVS